MNPAAWETIVSGCGAPYADYLKSIVRPSIDITLGRRGGGKDKSRLGGSPYVPRDFEWPAHPVGVYRFLGQFNLAEIASPPAELPHRGLLSFFYASANDSSVSEDEFDELDDDEWDALEEAKEVEIFWQDPGFVRAYYWPEPTGFQLRKGTISWRAAEEFPLRELTIRETKNRAIELSTGLDLPRHRVLRNDWPFDADAATKLLDEVREAAKAHQGHLLGYPSFTTLAYDPTPGDDWLPLLTLPSILDWCWHDGDRLMVFIEKERLARSDFSHLVCDAG